jgi:CO/xanthine dehydrogenase Mo-binding subunit
MGNGKIRSVGVAMAMQGSCISFVDTGAVTIKVNDDGFYTMEVGCTDNGMGCDTAMAQIAAESLDCDVDDIIVNGVDTDTSPYDCGSYASSTTYITGMAVVKTCATLIEKIKKSAAVYLKCDVEDISFEDGKRLINLENGDEVSLKDLANSSMCGNLNALEATEAHMSQTSPPPYMAGVAEIEYDTRTCDFRLVNYTAVIDCGTVINTALATVQAEGGLAQGIGMAMTENVQKNEKGAIRNNSFMQYKLPTRQDLCPIHVSFEPSYEPTGPFGAKSIGEIVCSTPSPAIAQAVYHASGVRIRELPITPEKIFKEKNNK